MSVAPDGPRPHRPCTGEHTTTESDFDAFYTATRQRLLGQLYALTGDLAEAQDCLQDAYLRAWQRWRTISGYQSPEAWVRLVAMRLATSRWHRVRNAAAAWRRHGAPDHLPAPSPDGVALTTALAQIPRAQRSAIVLHYLADLPVEQIARQTGTPTGTVKVWLSRGRAALAALLAEDASTGTSQSVSRHWSNQP